MVFNEALDLNIPINNPAVVSATRSQRTKPVKQAPFFPVAFLKEIERVAAEGGGFHDGRPLFAAGFALMCLASLRFADTTQLSSVERSSTAIHGILSRTKMSENPTAWAAPLGGVEGDTSWVVPIFQFRKIWEEKMSAPGPSFLFPMIDDAWRATSSCPATYNVVLRALRRLASELKFSHVEISLHSPRTFLATCANQLGWSREDREKLGRWAPGSNMPNRYDRATCATELRLRDSVLDSIRKGWSPAGMFEVPTSVVNSGDRDAPDPESPWSPGDLGDESPRGGKNADTSVSSTTEVEEIMEISSQSSSDEGTLEASHLRGEDDFFRSWAETQ